MFFTIQRRYSSSHYDGIQEKTINVCSKLIMVFTLLLSVIIIGYYDNIQNDRDIGWLSKHQQPYIIYYDNWTYDDNEEEDEEYYDDHDENELKNYENDEEYYDYDEEEEYYDYDEEEEYEDDEMKEEIEDTLVEIINLIDLSNRRCNSHNIGYADVKLNVTSKEEIFITSGLCINSDDLGVHQYVMNDNQTNELINSSISYYESKILSNSNYVQKLRHACKNLYEQCSYWSTIGECVNNPVFMLSSCSLACKSCLL